jgi:hypothetical protein
MDTIQELTRKRRILIDNIRDLNHQKEEIEFKIVADLVHREAWDCFSINWYKVRRYFPE